jgi:hypothetical protein
MTHGWDALLGASIFPIVCRANLFFPTACSPSSQRQALRSRGGTLSHSAFLIVTGPGLLRGSSDKSLASNRQTRFVASMVSAVRTVSKLCAWCTRHVQPDRLAPPCLHSTWQGEGQALPVASPPGAAKRHVKTLPVFTLSRLRAARRCR